MRQFEQSIQSANYSNLVYKFKFQRCEVQIWIQNWKLRIKHGLYILVNFEHFKIGSNNTH
jgi:hypothetical protein